MLGEKEARVYARDVAYEVAAKYEATFINH